jgi:hypothetical protein
MSEQSDYAKKIRFFGMTEQDVRQLKKGTREAFDLMIGGEWYSKEEICKAADGEEGLRRMRQLREWVKIESVRIKNSRAWVYRIVPKEVK